MGLLEFWRVLAGLVLKFAVFGVVLEGLVFNLEKWSDLLIVSSHMANIGKSETMLTKINKSHALLDIST